MSCQYVKRYWTSKWLMNVNDVRDIRHVTSSNMTRTHAAVQVSVMFINVLFRPIPLYAYKCNAHRYVWGDCKVTRETLDSKNENKMIILRCSDADTWNYVDEMCHYLGMKIRLGGEGNILRTPEKSQIDERWVMRAVIIINHTHNLIHVN